jgi:hypothetical protein
MGRSSQPFLRASEAPSSLLVTTSPLAMGKSIKRGPLERKETLIVGLRESTWRTLKKMQLMQLRVASAISVVI